MGRALAPARLYALSGSEGEVMDDCPDCGGTHIGSSVCTLTGTDFSKPGYPPPPAGAEYVPPLVTLPGAKVSPEVLLHRTLNKVGRIKAVTVVIQWDDDTFDMDWSSMKVSELCMAARVLSLEADKEIMR